MGDIVVTARRREERLRDVPLAASVFDAQGLAERGGAQTVQDIVQNASSVRFFNTTSQLNSEISIRGSGTARGTNADPSVGLYRNGMYIGGGYLGGRNFARIDFFDLGRAEVLKGTQGALYGRNAVGGAVNFVSAQPEFASSGFINTDYAFETQTFQIQAVGNQPLTDKLAVRIGFDVVRSNKGFFYNPNNDVYYDQNRTQAIRGQLRYKSGATDITLLAEHQDGEVPSVTFRVFIRPGGNTNFPLGYIQDPYSYPWNFPPLATQRVDNIILTSNTDLGFATLSTTGGYRRRVSYFQYDADGIDGPTLALLQSQGQARTTNANASISNADSTYNWSQDIHLASNKNGLINWLTGVELFSQHTRYQILSGTALTQPIPGNRTDGIQTYRSIAPYGSLGITLGIFSLTGELRYTADKKDITSAQVNRVTGVPTGGTAFQLNSGFAPNNLSYTVTASVKPTSGTLLYAKIGSAYRAGGFNYNLGDPRQPIAIPAFYGNENTTTIEAGGKGDITPWLYVTAAAYRTRTSNAIVGTNNGCAANNPQCPIASTPFLVNAGNARSWGIEIEANARATLGPGRLRMTLAGSRQGAKLVTGPFASALVPQVPDWVASASMNYRVPVGRGTSIFFNANYQGAFGGVNELVPAGTPFRQPASAGPYQSPIDTVSLLDLRAGVTIGKLEVALYARNALNYNYIVYETQTTQRPNAPRLIGLQVRKSW